MLKKERQEYILHELNLHNRVVSSALSADLNVSEDTIRRDLQELAQEKKIIKVHGGALNVSFNLRNGAQKEIYSAAQKKTIADKAIAFISDGQFILTSGGTTIQEMARSLPLSLKATFISGSIPAILEYMKHPNINVILVGDRISKTAMITVGTEAIAKVKEMKVDICFLGINAIDIQHGITENDIEVAQLKKAMIESSQKVVCLTISEKVNSFQPFQIAPIHKIHTLITELDATDALLEPYKNLGIEIV